MLDLNDLALFAAVVEHGSFSSAGRALGFPKSKVSRRIGDLEAQLGVRLLHRSTRVVSLTDAGSEFYKHCQSVTNAAKAAVDVAQRAAEGPIGKVRVSCPVGIAHLFLARILPQFLRSEPAVQLEFEITSRRVDVIAEGFDVAIRIRTVLDDSELVVHSLGISEQVLVASPAFVAEHGPFEAPQDLQNVSGVGPKGVNGEPPRWRIAAADGSVQTIEYRSLLVTDDVYLLFHAAVAGAGVAHLPIHVCASALDSGQLVALLPAHSPSQHQLHLVYPSRRGMVPAVRAFIEHLARTVPPTMKNPTGQYGCDPLPLAPERGSSGRQ